MIITHRTTDVSETRMKVTDTENSGCTNPQHINVTFVQKLVDIDDLIDNMARIVLKDDSSLYIKKVKFNSPATVVFWSDGTKTVVKDEDMKDARDVHVNVDKNELVYTVNDKKRKVNYTRWKEDGLLNAIMKKTCPNYFKLLDKYCL